MGECTGKRPTAQAVQEAMEQHEGLVHAVIRRQGGGDISYEEALQAGRIGGTGTLSSREHVSVEPLPPRAGPLPA